MAPCLTLPTWHSREQKIVVRSVWVLIALLCLGLVACGCAPGAMGAAMTPEASGAILSVTAATATVTATRAPTTRPSLAPTPTATLFPTQTPKPTPLPPLVAIDPGHGGEDLGAVRTNSDGSLAFTESDVNLAIALRFRDALEVRGYRVLLTRDGDYGLNPQGLDVNEDGNIDHLDDLQTRIDMANQAGADILVSIHQNSFVWPNGRSAPDVGGTVTFYNAYREFGDQNRRLALLVQRELVAAIQELGHDVLDRGAQVDHQLESDPEGGRFLIVLGPESPRIARASEMPGVLSETLFLTHDREAELLQDPQALDAIAEAYARAVHLYFESETTP